MTDILNTDMDFESTTDTGNGYELDQQFENQGKVTDGLRHYGVFHDTYRVCRVSQRKRRTRGFTDHLCCPDAEH